ncbi:MAG: TlpA disulfide reductase family protein [Elusimicrobiota bacterium]
MKGIARYAFVAIVALAWACTPSEPAGAPEAAAPLSGKTLNGKIVSLSDYKGKVVLVDFWATWCDPCKYEIPELIKLQDRLGAKGFAILSVSMDEDVAEVPPFVKAMKINYPVILNGSDRAPKGWVVPGLPTAYLIGRDGKVLQRKFGSKSLEKLTADVEAALAN